MADIASMPLEFINREQASEQQLAIFENCKLALKDKLLHAEMNKRLYLIIYYRTKAGYVAASKYTCFGSLISKRFYNDWNDDQKKAIHPIKFEEE